MEDGHGNDDIMVDNNNNNNNNDDGNWMNFSPTPPGSSGNSNDNVVTIIGIGGARLEFNELNKICYEKNFQINLIHIYWLKPFTITSNIISALNNSSFGIVVDSGYSICGASEHIANTLMIETGKTVYSLGLDDRTAGFSKKYDNITPSSKSIYEFMSFKLKNKFEK